MRSHSLVTVEKAKKEPRLEIRVYQVTADQKFRALVVRKDHVGNYVQLVRIQGRFSSSDLLLKYIRNKLQKDFNTTHPIPTDYYSEGVQPSFYYHHRQRKAEYSHFDSLEYFFFKGSESSRWPTHRTEIDLRPVHSPYDELDELEDGEVQAEEEFVEAIFN